LILAGVVWLNNKKGPPIGGPFLLDEVSHSGGNANACLWYIINHFYLNTIAPVAGVYWLKPNIPIYRPVV
jgi:hypothetical protein